MVEIYEGHFGPVRVQQLPCDTSIQAPDGSKELDEAGAKVFRTLIGTALYASQDRPDISFTVKELASKMSRPTTLSLARLKKLVVYLKGTEPYSQHMKFSQPGIGHTRRDPECYYVLEVYAYSDWGGNREHRKSSSAYAQQQRHFWRLREHRR